ncbi:MAG: DUF1697 domain-containing protein [Faecalibacterium sp.]
MKKYVAFLRGINISGKNKLAMPELKSELEAAGFREVSTYLNSGNVVFTSETAQPRPMIEAIVLQKFKLEIPVYLIEMEELRDILAHAPEWWDSGSKDKYDNLIFILSADPAEELSAAIGNPSEGIERVGIYRQAIFWTFERNAYQKCHWWKKTAEKGIAEKLTIRTANTVKKVSQR